MERLVEDDAAVVTVRREWRSASDSVPQPSGLTDSRLFRLLVVVLPAAVITGALAYIGLGAAGGMSKDGVRGFSPECAGLARLVAGRTNSILDGSRYRATERQVYEVCATDPAAFRRIVRGH